jgi:predicted  nucleic acid-binding Zn-ribbon protein
LNLLKKRLLPKNLTLAVKKVNWKRSSTKPKKKKKHYNKDAGAARAHVDERLLTSYDRIRKNYRNGLSVVPVERDSCGGCFHAIPPQKQSEIKLRKKIMVCENCGRILVDTDLNDSVDVK